MHIRPNTTGELKFKNYTLNIILLHDVIDAAGQKGRDGGKGGGGVISNCRNGLWRMFVNYSNYAGLELGLRQYVLISPNAQ